MGEDIARKEEQCNEEAETEPHGGVQGGRWPWRR